MKLLLVIDSFGSGGAQKQITTLAIGLANLGYEIEFFIYYPHYEHFKNLIINNNIKINEYHKRGRYDLTIIRELKKLVAKHKYDLILAFLYTPSMYAEFMRIWFKDLPIIVSIRSSYRDNKVGMSKIIKEQLHRMASHVTVNSHHQRLKMEKLFPWIREKISTIYNGVDLSEFKPMARNYGWMQSGICNILALGSIRRLKNYHGLVESLHLYNQLYGNNIKIDWAGKYPTTVRERESFDQANKKIKLYNLENSWNWIGEQTSIPNLINKYDALIMPSYHEGLPNAVCEALACGKPVIASNVGDNPILLQHGKHGYLFDPLDINSITNALRCFVTSSSTKKYEMSISARLFAERELNSQLYIRKYDALFKTLIS
jgi:GalNAc-alpha-(1->4)-GalNAc-alpha-(1->3)-diNAcBac-PP-undecaprenol alpha-1,4-N-acetyl-D-galactosaminyltransferase